MVSFFRGPCGRHGAGGKRDSGNIEILIHIESASTLESKNLNERVFMDRLDYNYFRKG